MDGSDNKNEPNRPFAWPSDRTNQKFFLAFQGGGARCASQIGMLEGFAERYPNAKVIGASGTSAGLLNATTFAEGYLQQGLQAGIERTRQLWTHMTNYQNKELGQIYRRLEEAAADHGTIGPLRASLKVTSEISQLWENNRAMWQRLMPGSNFGWDLSPMGIANAWLRPQKSHIIGLLDMMQEKGDPLRFDIIQKNAGKFDLIGNAVVAPQNGNPWHATDKDERVYGTKDIGPAVLAASGALPECSPAISFRGDKLIDGGFRANPNIVEAAEICQREGATLVVMRSRPGNAFPPHPHEPHDEDGKNAFFNGVLDRDLQLVRLQYPNLKIIVVEPTMLEEQNPRRLLSPTSEFHPQDIARRIEWGRQARWSELNSTSTLDIQPAVAARSVTGSYAQPSNGPQPGTQALRPALH